MLKFIIDTFSGWLKVRMSNHYMLNEEAADIFFDVFGAYKFVAFRCKPLLMI